MTQNVYFDPGIGELTVDFNEYVNNVYSQMMSFRTIHQKKARFKLYCAKIKNNMKNNIAFYLGCLLWGYYLYTENINSPKNIVGNPLLSLEESTKEEYDYLLRVNFLENYFEGFERDILYYTGEKYVIPEQWKKILSLYSEFLELNNGFLYTKSTSDLKIPEELKNYNFNFDIQKQINLAVESKNIELLLELVDFSVKA